MAGGALRGAAAIWLALALGGAARAQVYSAGLAGSVTDAAGKAVPGAKVALRNLATGTSQTAVADRAGAYSFAGLAPGNYEISVSADGFDTETDRVTLTGGATKTFAMKLTPALSLSSLGFGPAQTQGNARQQALLDKRSRMLQIHQKLGLITAFPLAATVFSGGFAGGKHSNPTARDYHMALGTATAGLYFSTAYFAIFAPKVEGVKPRGPTRFHKAMAFIHGPGMILTPIAGAMAESQRNAGEKPHGLAKFHGQIAVVTAIAYGLALLSETKPNWIPGLGGHREKSAPAAAQTPQPAAASQSTSPPRRPEMTRSATRAPFMLLCALLTFPAAGARARGQAAASAAAQSWALEKSTLTYHVSHPLHQVAGVSHEARGKGLCQGGQCTFLVAAPVKSFTSGDTNRDLHMLQVTRGAEFPMVVVRTQLPESALAAGVVRADLEVQFAGQTAHYKQLPFQLAAQGSEMRLTGTIPATADDFKITPPELLFVPIKKEIPISVDMTWQKQ